MKHNETKPKLFCGNLYASALRGRTDGAPLREPFVYTNFTLRYRGCRIPAISSEVQHVASSSCSLPACSNAVHHFNNAGGETRAASCRASTNRARARLRGFGTHHARRIDFHRPVRMVYRERVT